MNTESAQQFLQVVPSAQSRVLIDMVNSLDVARDHIRVSEKASQSLGCRFLGEITGSTQRRNSHIAQNHQLALESAIAKITDLAKCQTRSNFAIEQVANRLTYIETSLAHTANQLADVCEVVKQLRFTVDEQAARLMKEIAQMDLRSAASEQLDLVMSRWEAGKFNAFPRASRCFIAAHELYWGAYGEFIRQHPDAPSILTLKETFQNKASLCLCKSANNEEAAPLSYWLSWESESQKQSDIFVDGLAYLGSSCQFASQPWGYTLSQLPPASNAPKAVAQYISTDILAKRVTREFFAPARLALYA
jgi:hypothetical protein